MFTLNGECARPSLRLALIAFSINTLLVVCPVPTNAQCIDPVPDEPVEEQLSPPTAFHNAFDGTVAMHDDGDFVIAWTQVTNPNVSPSPIHIRAQRVCRSGDLLGDHTHLSIGWDHNNQGTNFQPSLAAGRGGHYHAAWPASRRI